VNKTVPVLISFAALWLAVSCPLHAAEPARTATLKRLFKKHPGALSKAANDAHNLRFHVRLSVVENQPKKPTIRTYTFGSQMSYVYPASAIKPAAAIAALMRLNRVQKKHGAWIDRDTPIRLGTSKTSWTVAKEIRKLLVISDNRAYNRLYDWVGQEPLNRMMWDAGLPQVRLSHHLGHIRSIEDNQKTPAIRLGLGKRTVRLPGQTSTLDLHNGAESDVRVGTAHIADGSRVDEPMDFTQKNFMRLDSLHELLILLLRPELLPGRAGFDLTDAQRAFLTDALRQLPHESKDPVWPKEQYDPHRFKPFLKGLERMDASGRFRVTSKAGRAYGFRQDNAYIEDTKTGRAFFLTAVIYTNKHGVLNDNKYQYGFADRVMTDVAEVVTRWVLTPR